MKSNRFLLLCFCLFSFAIFFGNAWASDEVKMPGFFRSKFVGPVRIRAEREWSFKIMDLVPEGKRVQEGEVLARVEGENILRSMRETENRIAERRVSMESSWSQLQQQVVTLEGDLKEQQEQLAVVKVQATGEGGASSPYKELMTPARDRLLEELDIENRELRIKNIQEKLKNKKHLLQISQRARGAEFQGMEMSLTRFQKDLDNFVLKSPRSGVVIYRRNANRQKPKIGATIFRGTELMAVVDDQNLFIECYLRESDLSRILIGSAVQIKILGQSESYAKGKVASISPVVMKVGDWEKTLPKSHPLFRLRAFRVKIETEQLPSDAKPEGEVIVKIDSSAQK